MSDFTFECLMSDDELPYDSSIPVDVSRTDVATDAPVDKPNKAARKDKVPLAPTVAAMTGLEKPLPWMRKMQQEVFQFVDIEGYHPWIKQVPSRMRLGPSMMIGLHRFNAGNPERTLSKYFDFLLTTSTTFPLVVHWGDDSAPLVKNVPWIPGHPQLGSYGPRKSRVMVVSKMPWKDEEVVRRNFAGPSGDKWRDVAHRNKLNFNDWYITNVCKFKPPTQINSIPVKYLAECLTILMYEISIVRPDFIICMGSDALQALMGSQARLGQYRNVATNYEWPGADWSATLMATEHPASALREVSASRLFDSDMGFIARVLKDPASAKKEKRSTNYRVLSTFEELDIWIQERIDANDLEFAVDCEWAGHSPFRSPTTNYLRSIQFSWAEGHAVYLKLVDASGVKFLSAHGKYVLAERLKRLLYRPGVRFIGHNSRSDLIWLFDLGLDDIPMQDAVLDGFDTMLASHVIDQSQTHGLESLAMRYTDMGRYDVPLANWVRENGYSVEAHGFAGIPDHIIETYAMADADCTFRCKNAEETKLLELHTDRLSRPHYERFDGIPCTPYTLYHTIEYGATLPILEMERNGLYIDRERMESLVYAYQSCLKMMQKRFRDRICWPNFNFQSIDHRRAFLFSDAVYKDKKPNPAPPTAKVLRCQPFKNTDHGHGIAWTKIVSRNEELLHSPSTDSDTLAVLAIEHKDEDITLLRNIAFVSQMCKSFLRAPTVSEETGIAEFTEGLLGHIDPDGRIRTSLSQLIETGRYGSSRPNLQNIPSKQEKILKKLLTEYGLGDKYRKVRSCFMASPGHIMLSLDYKSAELVVMAVYSQDKYMMSIVLDPNRDLHLETANEIFSLGLKLEGISSDGLEELKDAHKTDRIKAKAVNFGIPYGLGASGLVADLEAEGVDISLDEGEEILKKHARLMPDLHAFLEQSADAVVNEPGYFETVWGRRRHFFKTSDEKSIAAQRREAKNFPIQSVVADCLTLSLVRLYHYRRKHGSSFRLLLPVHDALMVETKPDNVLQTKQIVRDLMRIPIPGFQVALDVDVEVGLRWSEKASYEELRQAGVSDSDLEALNVKKPAA